jgi:hypothetical protein
MSPSRPAVNRARFDPLLPQLARSSVDRWRRPLMPAANHPPLALRNGPNLARISPESCPNLARRSLRQPAWAAVAVQPDTGDQHHRNQVLQQHLPPLGPGTPPQRMPTHSRCARGPSSSGALPIEFWWRMWPPLPCNRWPRSCTQTDFPLRCLCLPCHRWRSGQGCWPTTPTRTKSCFGAECIY